MFARLYQSMAIVIIGLAPLLWGTVPISALSKPTIVTVPYKVIAKAPKSTPTPQPQVATKPEEAKGPIAGRLVIEPQKTHWYKFNYHYNNQDKHSEPTQATVKLTAKAKGCLIFEVWTASGLQPGNGQKHKPVGVGTALKGVGRVLVWVGASTASETYYVAVKNRVNRACSYELSISGPDVSY